MLLRNLEVTNWRGLNQLTLQFSDGITIVGGPNESGKSSLRQALKAALLLPVGNRGEKKLLEANRPWATRLYPKVVLDFEIGKDNYSIQKEFLRSKDWAELRANGRLIAQDDTVQPELLKILGDMAEWIDVLWGTQGDTSLDVPAPESVKGRLAAAAQATVMPQVAQLQQLISDEYQKYWTEKRVQPTRAVQNLRDATTAAERKVHHIEQQIEAANQMADNVNAKLAAQDILQKEWEKLREQWKKGHESLGAWESFARVQAELKILENAQSAIRQWLIGWQSDVGSLRELWPEAQSWSQKKRELEPQVKTAPTRKHIDDLTAKQKFLELSINKKKRAELDALILPTASEIKELKASEERLREIDARLKMGEMRATLTADVALSAKVARDGKSIEDHSVAAGKSDEWTAEQGFELTLPGIAKLKVESGNPEVAADVARRAQIQTALAASLQKWQAQSCSELQERISERDIKLKQLPRVDANTFNSAGAAVADLESVENLSIDEQEKLLQSLPAAIANAESAWKTEHQAHQDNMTAYQKLLARNPEPKVEQLKKNIQARIKSAPFDVSKPFVIPEPITEVWLATLDEFEKPARQQLTKKEQETEELRLSVPKPEGDEITKDMLNSLQKQIDAKDRQLSDTSTSVNQLIGAVNAQGDLHAQLVEAQEAQVKAQAEQTRVDIEALAILELQRAVEEARSKLQKDVVAPLQDRVADYFGRITGGFYPSVKFDDSFRLSGLATRTISTVPLADISFGTKEQLALLTRLCLAELLSANGDKQVVILDDNLVHTDSDRMEVACRLLEEAAQNVQIIVFTCHPEGYSGIKRKSDAVVASR